VSCHVVHHDKIEIRNDFCPEVNDPYCSQETCQYRKNDGAWMTVSCTTAD
jgi:hypothetical protein